MAKDHEQDYEKEYDYDDDYYLDEYHGCCESKMNMAMKVGIGVAAIAIIGSLITFALIKKRNAK